MHGASLRFTDESPSRGFLSVQFFWNKKIWPELESSQATRLRRPRPESRFAPCMALHFDSQTKAPQGAFFLSNFFGTKKYGQNWNPLRQRGFAVLVLRAGSRHAWRFTSIHRRKPLKGLSFCPIFLEQKNMARTGILSGNAAS